MASARACGPHIPQRRSPHGTQQLGIYTAAFDGSEVRLVYRSEDFSAQHADWGPAT